MGNATNKITEAITAGESLNTFLARPLLNGTIGDVFNAQKSNVGTPQVADINNGALSAEQINLFEDLVRDYMSRIPSSWDTVQELQALGTNDGIVAEITVMQVASGNWYKAVTADASTSTWSPVRGKHEPLDYGADGAGGATDIAALAAAIAAAKLAAPHVVEIGDGSIGKDVPVPYPALTAGQSLEIMDYRITRTNPFGAFSRFLESRNGSNNQVCESIVQGSQNPGVTVDTLSVGDGATHSKANAGTSIVMRRHGVTIGQWVSDTQFNGDPDWALMNYSNVQPGGAYPTGRPAIWAMFDAAKYMRFVLNNGQFASDTRTVASATIEVIRTITGVDSDGGECRITTSVSHGWNDGDWIGVTGVVGAGQANGNWVVKNSTSTTATLTGAPILGTYVSGGQAQKFAEITLSAAITAPSLPGRSYVSISGATGNTKLNRGWLVDRVSDTEYRVRGFLGSADAYSASSATMLFWLNFGRGVLNIPDPGADPSLVCEGDVEFEGACDIDGALSVRGGGKTATIGDTTTAGTNTIRINAAAANIARLIFALGGTDRWNIFQTSGGVLTVREATGAVDTITISGAALVTISKLKVNGLATGFRAVADGAITLAVTDHTIHTSRTSGTAAVTMTTTGMSAGQKMRVLATSLSGGGTVTLACTYGGATGTVTLAANNDGVDLIYTGSAWVAEELLGAAAFA